MRLFMLLIGITFTGGLIWGIIDIYKVAQHTIGSDVIGYMGGLYFLIFGFLPLGLVMIYIAIKGEI